MRERKVRKKIIISYDGTNYGGWQIQPNRNTIQEEIEKKLSMLYAWQKIRVEASGRTDAGVHAIAQTAHYDEPDCPNLNNEKILKAMNRMLPRDIRIIRIEDVSDDFHARFSVLGKTYVYVINSGIENAFNSKYSWHYNGFKNIYEVRKSLKILEGKQDFSSFTVERNEIDNPERVITEAKLVSRGTYHFLCFTGEGFLYKMVRSIVGSLVFVGAGKIDSSQFKDILLKKDRREAFDTAPPHGLFLLKVYYNDEEYGKYDLNDIPVLRVR